MLLLFMTRACTNGISIDKRIAETEKVIIKWESDSIDYKNRPQMQEELKSLEIDPDIIRLEYGQPSDPQQQQIMLLKNRAAVLLKK